MQQKALRLEQILSILKVIGVGPAESFGELYQVQPWSTGESSMPTIFGSEPNRSTGPNAAAEKIVGEPQPESGQTFEGRALDRF